MPLNSSDRPPQIAVGAVCLRGGLLLLVRRGRGIAAGSWSLPGGRLEAGETLAEALIREMQEETGLAATVGELCGVAEIAAEGHAFVVLDYWVAAEGEAVAGDDAQAVRWSSRADLEGLELAPGLRDFLDRHGVLARMR